MNSKQADRARSLFKHWMNTKGRSADRFECLLFDFLVELGDIYDQNFNIIHGHRDDEVRSQEVLKALEHEDRLNRFSVSLRNTLGILLPDEKEYESDHRNPYNRSGQDGQSNIHSTAVSGVHRIRKHFATEEQRLRQRDRCIRQFHQGKQHDGVNSSASVLSDDRDKDSQVKRVNGWEDYCQRTANGQFAGLDGLHAPLEGVDSERADLEAIVCGTV